MRQGDMASPQYKGDLSELTQASGYRTELENRKCTGIRGWKVQNPGMHGACHKQLRHVMKMDKLIQSGRWMPF